MSVPVFSQAAVLEAVTPQDAYGAVRNAFLAHHSGEWSMPPKVYVTNYPAGDFRAMPAIGGGHALLKWVTSFPGNPTLGLPTVTGLVVLSNAETGQLEAVLEAAAVTALRTAAAATLAAEELGPDDGASVAVVGAGVNGAETARSFVARGRAPMVWDVDDHRRRLVAEELGVRVAGSLEEALACDVVVTVTPGRDVLYPAGSLRPGQHVSLMGADGPGVCTDPEEERAFALARELGWAAGTREDALGAEIVACVTPGHTPVVEAGDLRPGLHLNMLGADGPGKAEATPGAVASCALFCDEWAQASHGGELTGAVEAGLVTRDQVTDLGAVLAGEAPGRPGPDAVTLFDSTGLAIQDLAIARAALLKSVEMDLPRLEL